MNDLGQQRIRPSVRRWPPPFETPRPERHRVEFQPALLRQAPAALLTVRERKDAACVARGMSNPQIAAALVVSEPTAQNHVQHILTKLGFSRRSQIAVWAVQNLRS